MGPLVVVGTNLKNNSGLSRYAEGMLGIDPRAVRVSWTVILMLLLVAAAYAIRETLAVFIIALLFAYLLMPLLGLVERFTPRQVSPRLALGIVYLLLVGVIVALASTLGSRLVDEANSLASQLPALVRNGGWMQFPLPAWLEPVRDRITQTVQEELNTGGQQILPYIRSVGGHLVSGARYALYLVLIPILAFFFLKDGSDMREGVVTGFFEEERRPVVDEILEDINRLLGEYIRALVLLSLSAFTANAVFLGITGAPVCDPAGRSHRARRVYSGGRTGGRGPDRIVGCRADRLWPFAVVCDLLGGFPAGAGLWPVAVPHGQGRSTESYAGIVWCAGGRTDRGRRGNVSLRAGARDSSRDLPAITARTHCRTGAADGKGMTMRLGWLFLIALPAAAHMVSMSTGDLKVDGNRAHYELRIPMYEVAHVHEPEHTLLDHVRFRDSGAWVKPSRIRRCHQDRTPMFAPTISSSRPRWNR